jgi:hypothetical protein
MTMPRTRPSKFCAEAQAGPTETSLDTPDRTYVHAKRICTITSGHRNSGEGGASRRGRSATERTTSPDTARVKPRKNGPPVPARMSSRGAK